MTDCFQPWNDNFNTCTNAVGGMKIPTEPTDDNVDRRAHFCMTPACQQLVVVYRSLIASKCARALEEAATNPKGMHTTTYCPTTTMAPTTTPPPTTVAPVTTTTPLTTTSPPPASTTLLPTQTPVPETVNSAISTTTIAAASGAVVVILVLVAIIIVLLRRNANKHKRTTETDCNSHIYVDITTAATDDETLNEAPFLQGSAALGTVRISYKKLQFGNTISQGGFGEVVEGYYNDELVAIKRLLPSRRRNTNSIRSFFDEIQLTATLEHECIVRLIGVAWDVPANLCMVTELMRGGDLRALLSEYAASGHPKGHDDHKLQIAVQVAHALTYLHTLSTPVVHRDLKSRNILLSAEGNAKLIDFGISCERQDVTMTAGVGTSLWMAPEVMLGKRYDEKADVFSFGVILSELDTHELPYDHARDPDSNRKMADVAVMQKIVEGSLQPRFTDHALPQIITLARDCLQIDPTKRPRASDVLYRIHSSRYSGSASSH